MMSSEREKSSNDKLLKELERLEDENIKLNIAKIKNDNELGYYKMKVDELNLRVTRLETEIQVLVSNQRQAGDEEKISTHVSNLFKKKKTHVSNHGKDKTFHLSVELIIEILSRLPVKSLLRFTAVNRTWKSLIKSNYFISMHLKQYPRNPDLICSSLIVASNWEITDTCLHFQNVLQNPVKFELLYPGQRDNVMFVGVCDGLVCVSLSYKECDFVICNPATRQFNQIPSCQQWDINNRLDYGCGLFGFGLHHSDNDYKLVIITYTYELISGFYQAHIYSMSSDDWKVFELSMPFECDLETSTPYVALVVAKGVFYWEAKKRHSDEWVLLSFNVNDEVLHLVDTPQCCECDTYDIIQWKEEVALISEYSDKERNFDVWLLDAVSSHWSKKYKVKLLLEIEFSFISFVGRTRNGDLLLENRKEDDVQLYSYDTKENEINKLHVGNANNYYSFCYVDSLLPVKKKNHTCTEMLWCWRN